MKSKHRMIVGLANDEIGYILRSASGRKAAVRLWRKKAQYGEEIALARRRADLVRGV